MIAFAVLLNAAAAAFNIWAETYYLLPINFAMIALLIGVSNR